MAQIINVNADFFHHLYDTIILLGGTIEIATMVKNPKAISDSDIESLRRYNGGLIDSTKNKLVRINTIRIKVAGE